MKQSRRMQAKKSVYRWGIFCLIAFIPIILEGFLFVYLGMPMVVNMLLLIATLVGLYYLYVFICKKIDKAREKKREESKTKDPFSD